MYLTYLTYLMYLTYLSFSENHSNTPIQIHKYTNTKYTYSQAICSLTVFDVFDFICLKYA